MSPEAKDSSVPREVLALLSKGRLIVRETQRAVTPFGGIVVFVQFLQRIDLMGQIRQYMPIHWRSHNQIDPTATLTAFLVAVLVGARRFVHANWLRGDQALHALRRHSRPRRPASGASPVRKLGRSESTQSLVRQHLALTNPNFAEVAPRYRNLIAAQRVYHATSMFNFGIQAKSQSPDVLTQCT
jgi:hypothetical protein